MGFYLRKSIRVGPFRLNLSKSGVGVSAGIPGLRFGTGPRGNYVHAGRGGLFYRRSLSDRKTAQLASPAPSPKVAPTTPTTSEEVIDSGSVLKMTDASAAELLSELNSKFQRPRYWRWLAIIWFIAFVVFGSTEAPNWVFSLVFVAGLIGIPVTMYFDWKAKRTALLYELDAELEALFRKLCEAFDRMAGCARAWHISSKSGVIDPKYHAGAGSAVERKTITLRYHAPPHVKTNISVPCIPVGAQTIYFFPDRLLVYSPEGVGAVAYEALRLDVIASRFVEEQPVPHDSKTVDRTWRYVNKNGGPDKRFKDNRELPIVLYEAVYFVSDSGLNELINLSKTEVTEKFRDACSTIGKFWQETPTMHTGNNL